MAQDLNKKYPIGGYLSSDGFVVSAANQQIFPPTPSDWTADTYVFKKLSFYNTQKCTVIINEQHTIVLEAGVGFEVSRDDIPVESFVIVEAGIDYVWIGAY